ncbi:MAG: hypothetical protein ABIS00_11860 [Gemmatimonadales bacterium]
MPRFHALLPLALIACTHPATSPAPASAVPAMILGEFQDDYGNHFTISNAEWFHRPKSRYHILIWNVPDQYAIAQNDSSNPGQRGRWTRIDWMSLSGMAPWEWGFCLTAYDAPSLAAAEATTPARREVPRTGCNGFPFSRMRRLGSANGG